MKNSLDSRHAAQLTKFLDRLLADHFPEHDTSYVISVLKGVQDLFAGRHPGYQASDTAYHNFSHTCQATEAMARILDGHIGSWAEPKCTARDFDLAVSAALLHDSGYIKRIGDNEGTGAKYTLTHVERSADFAASFLPGYGVDPEEVKLVMVAIRCTGVNVEQTMWSFLNEREWLLGCALGAGDILGQMAAPDYPERLPALYREYREAVDYSKLREGPLASFTSAEDLMRRTRDFYQKYARHMLNTVWGGVHESLAFHFIGGKNDYFKKIEANLDRIDEILKASPTSAGTNSSAPDAPPTEATTTDAVRILV
jgi:hypothetical protein